MEVNYKIIKKKHRSKYKTPKSLYLYIPTPSTTSEYDSDTDMEDYDEDQLSDFCRDVVPRNLLESY